MRKVKKRKFKKKSLIIVFFLIVCIFGLVYSVFNIYKWQKNVNKNNDIKKEINKSITINEEEENIEDKYVIDFVKLKAQNQDTIAYIKINDTQINYVVVKGNDNNYYLDHNFNKEYNVAGWIFADYKNEFDGTDKNIIIYGHNMRDGSMFGTLQKILNYPPKNSDTGEIVLATENEIVTYKIFSSYSIAPEDYYIQTSFANDDAYLKFLNELKSRSIN